MRDPADALEVADRITVLRRGRIVQCGTPSEIFGVPASRFRWRGSSSERMTSAVDRFKAFSSRSG